MREMLSNGAVLVAEARQMISGRRVVTAMPACLGTAWRYVTWIEVGDGWEWGRYFYGEDAREQAIANMNARACDW